MPFVVYPHRWIREEAIAYIDMCIDTYPSSKLYLLFSRLLDAPFPLEAQDKGDLSLLPRMLSSREVDTREKRLLNQSTPNKTVELFGRYLAKLKPPKEFPQIDEAYLNKWRTASRDLVSDGA